MGKINETGEKNEMPLNLTGTIKLGEASTVGFYNLLFESTGTTTSNYNPWSNPVRIEVIENQNNIEFIYKQYSTVSHGGFYESPSERVFKIVYSCVDGKWHKSEPIYGEIIKATDEKYKFE